VCLCKSTGTPKQTFIAKTRKKKKKKKKMGKNLQKICAKLTKAIHKLLPMVLVEKGTN
jgi:hypothetical protein